MTGLRRGEICGLKWTDINFDDGTITIKRTVSAKHGGGIRIGDTKTDAGTRTIVLPPSVLATIHDVNVWEQLVVLFSFRGTGCSVNFFTLIRQRKNPPKGTIKFR